MESVPGERDYYSDKASQVDRLAYKTLLELGGRGACGDRILSNERPVWGWPAGQETQETPAPHTLTSPHLVPSQPTVKSGHLR